MDAPVIATETYPATHRPAIAALAGASAVGLLAAIFLPLTDWGFGFPIVVLGILGISFAVRRPALIKLNRYGDLLWIGIVLFALLFVWRDASELRFLSLAMVAIFTGTMAIRMQHGPISKGGVWDYPFRALGAWLVAFIDTITLIASDISWKLNPQKNSGRNAASVLRGFLIATPLLLMFGALFVNADARFERLLTGSVQLDAQTIFERLVIGGAFAWFSAGLFRRMYLGFSSAAPPTPNTATPPPPPRLGTVEMAIVLGSLNVLFLLFVSTQWNYFFGGAEVVKSTAGLGVAEFARRGFFELVAVAGLSLPLLLVLHACSDPENRTIQKLYKVLASSLVLLLTVVMHSAWLKMQLYMGSFGLTTMRVYVAATLIWLALVFIWFTLTTLNQRADRFAWGGILALAATVFGLQVLNPDRFVANWNIQHQAPGDVDWAYLSSLSADAAPVLARAWDRIPAESRQTVAHSLTELDKLALSWQEQNVALINFKGSLGPNREEILALGSKEWVIEPATTETVD